jgi:hypothetical protein
MFALQKIFVKSWGKLLTFQFPISGVVTFLKAAVLQHMTIATNKADGGTKK